MRVKVMTKMLVRRRQMGITQDGLARTIGVTQPRISLWENRLADMPKARAAQISDILHLDPDELLQDA